MSKFGKFKEIFGIGSAIAKPFVPGAAGSILDAVTKGLDSTGNPASGKTADAIKQLAADNDEQTQAILALHERIKILEAKQ
jgi:hypothetical protein